MTRMRESENTEREIESKTLTLPVPHSSMPSSAPVNAGCTVVMVVVGGRGDQRSRSTTVGDGPEQNDVWEQRRRAEWCCSPHLHISPTTFRRVGVGGRSLGFRRAAALLKV
ncbi:hypothetical protein FOCC_FOCC014196 [Frankliniella occidentalis]|nr:hypothetical protein FOCC_FOCC014196 [Frankliniella occidentalis]